MKVSQMRNADLMAEVTDDTIDDLKRQREMARQRCADLRDKIEAAEADLDRVGREIAEWCDDTRAALASEGR